MAPASYTVQGMSCEGCEQEVETAVGEIEGVESVDADNVTDSIEVEGDVDSDDLEQAIEGTGFSFSG